MTDGSVLQWQPNVEGRDGNNTAGGRFDAGLARDLLAYLRERGVDGVLILETTAEFNWFSVAERKKILGARLREKGSLEVRTS